MFYRVMLPSALVLALGGGVVQAQNKSAATNAGRAISRTTIVTRGGNGAINQIPPTPGYYPIIPPQPNPAAAALNPHLRGFGTAGRPLPIQNQTATPFARATRVQAPVTRAGGLRSPGLANSSQFQNPPVAVNGVIYQFVQGQGYLPAGAVAGQARNTFQPFAAPQGTAPFAGAALDQFGNPLQPNFNNVQNGTNIDVSGNNASTTRLANGNIVSNGVVFNQNGTALGTLNQNGTITSNGVTFDQFGNPIGNGFANGVGNGFVGTGGVYAPGYAVTTGPNFPVGLPVVPGAGQFAATPSLRGTTVPTLGVNVPPVVRTGMPLTSRTSSGRRVAMGPRLSSNVAAAAGTQFPTERVAGSRQETSGSETRDSMNMDVKTASADPQQLKVVERAEDLMENRPLREGQVVRIGATGVTVKYEVNGDYRTERFPVGQVFFFQNDKLAALDTAPSALREGDRVMIPESVQEPREAVAGSREETTAGAVSTSSGTNYGMNSQRVAGSRQTTSRTAGSRQVRSRRPAK